MPQRRWTDEEERQYKHIKRGARKRGAGSDRAEEIAARTVNKQRAQAGETKAASRASTKDVSAYKRGGKRSGKRVGPQGRTKAQLYEEARRQHVEGRSKMTKAELEKALKRR